MMVGALLQIGKGIIQEEHIVKLLAEPESEHPSIPRTCAPANGLTLIDVVYKDGHLSKEPKDIQEWYFMRGYKRRLERLGIVYEVPDPNKEQEIGNLFDD